MERQEPLQPLKATAGRPLVPRFLTRKMEPARGWFFLSSGDSLALSTQRSILEVKGNLTRMECSTFFNLLNKSKLAKRTGIKNHFCAFF